MSLKPEFFTRCRKLVPLLSETAHKGTCGRIGIFGGSVEFTGAPYFAGISALRTGADLAYVFCTSSAAIAIKSYCPELMVLPYLDSDDAVVRISPWLKRLHAVLIGPGLGRNDTVLNNVLSVVQELKVTPSEQGQFRPIVLDADGIHFLSHNPTIFKDYQGDLYLTPNVVEFNNLVYTILGHKYQLPAERDVELLCRTLGQNVTLTLKGNVDIVGNSDTYLNCDVAGSFRRCGGQGDILSGVLTTFAAWTALRRWSDYPNVSSEYPDNILAAFSACYLVKSCSRAAFAKHFRSMLATDMIVELPKLFHDLFEEESK